MYVITYHYLISWFSAHLPYAVFESAFLLALFYYSGHTLCNKCWWKYFRKYDPQSVQGSFKAYVGPFLLISCLYFAKEIYIEFICVSLRFSLSNLQKIFRQSFWFLFTLLRVKTITEPSVCQCLYFFFGAEIFYNFLKCPDSL